MARDIVLLLDGTSNEISADRTNILRLYGTLKKSDTQIVWYDPGVGTFGGENAWSSLSRKAQEIWGMATGWGLDSNVKEAYRFLVDTVQVDDNGQMDRIWLFGFSRGAYTARVLAGFLHAFGLMEARNLNLLPYAYRAYKRIGENCEDAEGSSAFDEMQLFQRIIDPKRIQIRFMGLFDTVSSVIESGRFLPRLRSHAFTAHNPSVQSVRHAVALHERRTMFRAQLWPEDQPWRRNPWDMDGGVPQDAREVWFRGVHPDIGGGLPEEEAALAKLPLNWMIRQANAEGLKFKKTTVRQLVNGWVYDRRKVYTKPDPTAEQHESMTALWSLVEYVPRRTAETSKRPSVLGWSLPMKEWRYVPDNARIHASVFERADLPPNLPGTHRVEPWVPDIQPERASLSEADNDDDDDLPDSGGKTPDKTPALA